MIKIYDPWIDDSDVAGINSVVSQGLISSQCEIVGTFEDRFAAFVGSKFGVSTSNCTTALQLALLCLDVGPGDTVICPSLTFIAPVNMVAAVGATPVLCDVDPETACLDPDHLESLIQENNPAAMVVVHAFGNLAQVSKIQEIAQRHDVPIIDDCAESLGALYDEQPFGKSSHISCYSFFANKVMTTGEGGMLCTSNESIMHKAKIIRDHGMNPLKRYDHIALGFNFRMTAMQAALGVSQLKRLPNILERKAQINRKYETFAAEVAPELRVWPVQAVERQQGVSWLVTISSDRFKGRVSEIQSKMASEFEVDIRPMIPPICEAKHFQYLDNSESSIAKALSETSIHVPSSPLLSDDEIELVLTGLNHCA